jgi:hypothetical protein
LAVFWSTGQTFGEGCIWGPLVQTRIRNKLWEFTTFRYFIDWLLVDIYKIKSPGSQDVWYHLKD